MHKQPLLHLILTAIGLLALASATGCTGTSSDPNPYSDYQLNTWIETVRDAVSHVPASSGSGIGFRNLSNKRIRIQLRAYPLRGARKAMEDAISTVDVPRDAIVLEVGCESPDPSSFYPRISSDEPFLESINFSLEVPPQIAYGETVPLKLTLENDDDKRASLIIGGSLPEDFVVTTPDGKGIWYWDCGRFDYDAIYGLYLEPGEKREFLEEWQQVNHQGEPVPPGEYDVYGTILIGPLDQPKFDLYRLTTPPHRLQILKRWDPLK